MNLFIRWIGPIGLIGVVLCWGVTPVMLRELAGPVDAWTANGVRYPFAAMLYWPVLAWGLYSGRLNRGLAVACIVPAVFSLLAQVLWGMAPYYLEAQAMGFFARLSMIFATLAAMVLFADERKLLRQPLFWLGMAMLLGGFMAFAWYGGYFASALTFTGVVIMLFCSFFFGMYAVSVRSFLRNASPLYSFAVVVQFVSIGTIAGMFSFGEPIVLPTLSLHNWGLLLISATLGIAMGHVFLYAAVQRFGASVATAAQTATPFITVLLASIFLGEQMNAGQWPAGVAMVVGTIALLRAQHQIERKALTATPVQQPAKACVRVQPASVQAVTAKPESV